LLKRHEELNLFSSLHSLPDFHYCAYPNCGSGQEVIGGVKENNFFKCVKCNHKTCLKHRVVWHSEMTCQEYETNVEPNTRWVNANTKECPRCKVPIEKADDGCDHMTCKNFGCGFEFCFGCLAPFDLIRKNGNHFHQPTCRFYAPYIEYIVIE